MYKLLAGTTNKNKLLEIEKLLSGLELDLVNLSDFAEYPEVEEDGFTFKENAFKKAHAYFKYFRMPVFADDSGLVVPALNNEPGVFSARYAGESATYTENNQLLIRNIKAIDPSERQGRIASRVSTSGILRSTAVSIMLFCSSGLKEINSDRDIPENFLNCRGTVTGSNK